MYLSLSSDQPAGGTGSIRSNSRSAAGRFPTILSFTFRLGHSTWGSVFPLRRVGVYFLSFPPRAQAKLGLHIQDLGTVYIGKTTYLHGGAFEERGMRRYFSGGITTLTQSPGHNINVRTLVVI